jgi:hypothetical protein
VADLLRAYPGRARSRGAGVQPGVAASGRASGAPPRALAHPGVQMMGDALGPLAVQPPGRLRGRVRGRRRRDRLSGRAAACDVQGALVEVDGGRTAV